MKKYSKLIAIISLAALSFFVTYQICYWTAEKYFFDKFFYKKSVKHGYLFCDQDGCHLEKYGKRSKDIINLLSKPSPDNQTTKVLGKNAEDIFTIAVIGDSYVWGVGVKNNERFPVLLEKKLNETRKTKILSYGYPGHNLIDHLVKMNLIFKSPGLNIDLYIFTLITNDILIRQKKLKDQVTEQIIKECSSVGEYIYNDYATYNKDNHPYHIWVDKAWKNEANLCVFEKCISYFPYNTIYFATTDYYTNNEYDAYEVYKNILEKNDFFVLSAKKGREIENYQKYWDSLEEHFHVSQKEPHSSKIAHQMYADILYQEITTYPRWGFIKNHDPRD